MKSCSTQDILTQIKYIELWFVPDSASRVILWCLHGWNSDYCRSKPGL